MDGFYWLIPNLVAGSPAPGTAGDLDFWRSAGIVAVVSLTEEPLDFGSLETLRLPIPDMTAPSVLDIERAIAFLDEKVARRQPAVVHCVAGKGRTGTVLAAWLVHHGTPAAEAITRIRGLAPGSIETLEQENRLFNWEDQHH